MSLNPSIASFLAQLPRNVPPSPVEAMRANAEVLLRRLHGPDEQIHAVRSWMVPGQDGYPIRVRSYVPATATSEPLPVLVYAHGGGWFQCSLDLYDNPCRVLANATQCIVLSVDYRLAPEYKFPVPLDDYYAVLCWVEKNAGSIGADPQRVIVAGDSAGANLAAAAALRARDTSGPRIDRQLLLYPPLDARMGFPSFAKFAEGYFLTRAAMEFCWKTYLRYPEEGDHPYASPLRASDLTGLPTATVVVCEYDPLCDEGEAYARRLSECGVSAKHHKLPGMVHACIHMLGITPDARQIFDLASTACSYR